MVPARPDPVDQPAPAAGPELHAVETGAQQPHTEQPAGPEGQPGVDTAAEIGAFAAWARRTFTPPDVWRERQPSAAEEVALARQAAHLPEQGHWRAAAAAYAYPAAALICLLHAFVWVLRSPARTCAAAAALLAVLITYHLTF